MDSRDASAKTFLPRVSSLTSLKGKAVDHMAPLASKGVNTGEGKLAYKRHHSLGNLGKGTLPASFMLGTRNTSTGIDDGNIASKQKKSMFLKDPVQRMAWVTRKRWRRLGNASHLKIRRDCLFGMHRQVLQKLVYASEATGRGDLDDWEDTYVTRSWKNFRNKVCRRKSLKRQFHGVFPRTLGSSSNIQQINHTLKAEVDSSRTSTVTEVQDYSSQDSAEVDDVDLSINSLFDWVKHTSKLSLLWQKVDLTTPITNDLKGNIKLQGCDWEASTKETNEQEPASILSLTSEGCHTPVQFCASTKCVDDFPALTADNEMTHENQTKLEFLKPFTCVPGSETGAVLGRDSSRSATLDTAEGCNSQGGSSSLAFHEDQGGFVHYDLQEMQQLFLAQGPGEILIGGRFELSGGGMEFLFVDANSMSKAIGVGLEHSKVVLTSSLDIEVIMLGKEDWEAKWIEGLKMKGSFNLMSVKLLEVQKRATQLITVNEMAQRFGVGLIGSNGIATDLTMETDDEYVEMEPFLFEVARFMLRNHPVPDGEDNYTAPAIAALFRRQNNAALSQRFSRVTVRPRQGRVVVPDNSTGLPSNLLNLAGICPTLTMQFEEESGRKMFTIETVAECALRDNETTGPEECEFGWYQDELNLSLRCLEDDKAVLLDSIGMLHSGEVNNTLADGVSDAGEDLQISCGEISEQFYCLDVSSMGEATLAYRFFRRDVPDFEHHPGPDQQSCAQSSIYATLIPSIKGLWEPITDDEDAPYLFKMDRVLLEKNASASEPEDGLQVTQPLELPLLINHAMTHLEQVGGHRKAISMRVLGFRKNSPT
ncbi:unnamed protein product [Sphagnum balticum]